MTYTFSRLAHIADCAGIVRGIFHKTTRFTTSAIASTVASTIFSLFGSQFAYAAMPTGGMMESRYDGASISNNQPPANLDRQTAISVISGSPWPGIIDHLLQKPLQGDSGATPQIHITYPSLGIQRIDSDIRSWVESLADAFSSHLDMNVIPPLGHVDDLDMQIDRFLQDDDLNADVHMETKPGNFELWGTYRINRPSPSAISITWELWNYTGGQGNLDVLTLNYNLLNGQRLGLLDIFEHPDTALRLMSSWSRDNLRNQLGEGVEGDMLHTGTEPLPENFSSLTLLPDGICINFQPYQVAPWEAGIQKVKMPLDALMEAAPFLALWGKQ